LPADNTDFSLISSPPWLPSRPAFSVEYDVGQSIYEKATSNDSSSNLNQEEVNNTNQDTTTTATSSSLNIDPDSTEKIIYNFGKGIYNQRISYSTIYK
jgi:hypothetical protein